MWTILSYGACKMIDKNKSKVQLLRELAKPCQQIAKLEKSETKHKHTEEALKESEEIFRSISASAQDGIVMIDNDGNISYWNKAAERIFGYSKKEVVGKEVHIFLGPRKYHSAYKKGFSRSKKTKKDPAEGKTLEMAAIRKNGKRFPIELSVSAVKIQRKWHSIGIIRDITKHKQAEEELKKHREHFEETVEERTSALRESEEKYKTLFESTPEGIFSSGPDRSIMSANPASAEILGYSNPEELIGMPIVKLYPDPESRKKLLSELGKKGYLRDYEVKIKRKDGTIRDLLANLKLIKDSNGDILRIDEIFSDITNRKQAEENLKNTMEDLVRSNKELEQFAYVASHDLQEPLRMVSSYVQLLERRYKGKLDSDADEFIAYAVDGASRMQRLINDLLSYSRVGTRGKELKKVACSRALGQATANLSGVIEATGAVVTNDDLPTLKADEFQLIQLFQNLIDNAIKFRSKEPPRIHVSARKKEKEWLLSVSDNGIGIDPQYAERIFVIFQRLHERDKYPGTGIGLAICKRIVERHGGRIWVESEPRKGSTFFFTIPRKGGKYQ
jgi:PAS domain S-box-containing protein